MALKPLGYVRPATAADMQVIEAWLPKDRTIDTMAGNWKITMQQFMQGKVEVWEEATSGLPVAYCWGSLNSHDSVMEVHPDYRRQGVGRLVAEHMLHAAAALGDPLLEIQVAPESAEPFWQSLGFSTYWDHNACYGRRMLEFKHPAASGMPLAIKVDFFPEKINWAPDTKPLATYELVGRQQRDESIILDTTVAHYDLRDGDLVISITVDGKLRYQGKAKYEDAEAAGVERFRNGFGVKTIRPDDAL